MPREIASMYADARAMEDFNLWLIGNFSNTLRRSFFVSLYSFLESQLVQECHVRRILRGGLGRSLSDMKGMGINQAKGYLTTVLGVKVPFTTHDEGWRSQ